LLNSVNGQSSNEIVIDVTGYQPTAFNSRAIPPQPIFLSAADLYIRAGRSNISLPTRAPGTMVTIRVLKTMEQIGLPETMEQTTLIMGMEVMYLLEANSRPLFLPSHNKLVRFPGITLIIWTPRLTTIKGEFFFY